LIPGNFLDRHPGDLSRIVASGSLTVRRRDPEILDPVGHTAWPAAQHFADKISYCHNQARLLGNLASDGLLCALAWFDPPARQRPSAT
jgi:hypothetical protein